MDNLNSTQPFSFSAGLGDLPNDFLETDDVAAGAEIDHVFASPAEVPSTQPFDNMEPSFDETQPFEPINSTQPFEPTEEDVTLSFDEPVEGGGTQPFDHVEGDESILIEDNETTKESPQLIYSENEESGLEPRCSENYDATQPFDGTTADALFDDETPVSPESAPASPDDPIEERDDEEMMKLNDDDYIDSTQRFEVADPEVEVIDTAIDELDESGEVGVVEQDNDETEALNIIAETLDQIEENDQAVIPEQEGADMEVDEAVLPPSADVSQGEKPSGPVDELIADIFGESDEEEEFEGFGEDEVGPSGAGLLPGEIDEDDLRPADRDLPSDFEWDFDVMMRRRKEDSRKRYRKRQGGVDFINDADEIIQGLIVKMKNAAKADQEANVQRLPALRKRKLLPMILHHLNKSDLQQIFIENGIISVFTDWISPLPDRSLPALEIRCEVLKMLQRFGSLDSDILKTSNIGKAVMYIYKHPKETKDNKVRCGKLIQEWARPIFQLDSDFRAMNKEERQQRDLEHLSAAKRKRLSQDPDNRPTDAIEDPQQPTRPGEKGWISRARVPRPSTCDYVVRPRSTVDVEFKKSKAKQKSRYAVKFNDFKNRTKQVKAEHAIGVSLSGAKMSL